MQKKLLALLLIGSLVMFAGCLQQTPKPTPSGEKTTEELKLSEVQDQLNASTEDLGDFETDLTPKEF